MVQIIAISNDSPEWTALAEAVRVSIERVDEQRGDPKTTDDEFKMVVANLSAAITKASRDEMDVHDPRFLCALLMVLATWIGVTAVRIEQYDPPTKANDLLKLAAAAIAKFTDGSATRIDEDGNVEEVVGAPAVRH